MSTKLSLNDHVTYPLPPKHVVYIFQNLNLYFPELSSAFLIKLHISLDQYTNTVKKPIRSKLYIKSNISTGSPFVL